MDRLSVVQGDITVQAVDALINAANERMLGGGGVDGAIHRTAGPGLRAECAALPEIRPGVRCPTGEARLTGGHDLHARYVIHTVGPVWRGGGHGEAALLAGCYRACFALAREHRLRSLSFPAISTGAYGYPVAAAAGIAVTESQRALAAGDALEVRLVCFDDRTAEAYRTAVEAE